MGLSLIQIAILSSFSILTASAQMMFKKASMTLPPLTSFDLAFQFVTNIWLVGAIILNVVAIVLWVIVLQKTPLSVAYPFAALAFIIVPFLAWYIHNETISMFQIMGAILIVLGIVVASMKVS
jgi:drug/metabolite transporter (DMT)-like permease